MYHKKDLIERDICTKFITPALERSGWDNQLQVLEEFAFTDGRVYVKGKLKARGDAGGIKICDEMSVAAESNY